MSEPVVFSSFGGDSTVGSIATQYPLAPGVDVLHDTAAGVGALAASNGAVAGELVKVGTATLAVGTAATATDAITFTEAFPTACDAVLLTLGGLGGAVVNGPAYAASVSTSGFTASLDVTTAGSGNVTAYYVAFGH